MSEQAIETRVSRLESGQTDLQALQADHAAWRREMEEAQRDFWRRDEALERKLDRYAEEARARGEDLDRRFRESREEFARSLQESREEFARSLQESREESARSLQESREESHRSLQENRDEFRRSLQESREEFDRGLRESREPILVFLVTRGGLFLLAYLSLAVLPLNPDPSVATPASVPWRGFPGNLWLDGWARWDAGWYEHIARHGYVDQAVGPAGQRNLAFYPLYPLTMRLVSLAGPEPLLAGILVSNGALRTFPIDS